MRSDSLRRIRVALPLDANEQKKALFENTARAIGDDAPCVQHSSVAADSSYQPCKNSSRFNPSRASLDASVVGFSPSSAAAPLAP